MRRFSVIVPSWRDKEYLHMCLESLYTNSAVEHEVLVHCNELDSEIMELASTYDPDCTGSAMNKGIAFGANRGAERATTDWLFFVDSDCVFLPGWDTALNDTIDKFGENNIFPVTKIEPKGSNPSCVIKNYGTSIETFNYESLLRDSDSLKRDDYQVVSAGPWLSPAELFEGFDERMFPGWHIDADAYVTAFTIDPEVRFIKSWSSLIYHFSQTSTGRIGTDAERQAWAANAYKIFDDKWKKIYPGINSHNYQKFIEQPVEGLGGR